MQMKADESVLTKLVRACADEGKAQTLLEMWRWPNGPVPPHCQNTGEKRISKLEAQSTSPGERSQGRLFLRCLPPADNGDRWHQNRTLARSDIEMADGPVFSCARHKKSSVPIRFTG